MQFFPLGFVSNKRKSGTIRAIAVANFFSASDGNDTKVLLSFRL